MFNLWNAFPVSVNTVNISKLFPILKKKPLNLVSEVCSLDYLFMDRMNLIPCFSNHQLTHYRVNTEHHFF